MANRFWVGGTGNWNATTTHWSTTSGGGSGASAPGPGDAAIFDGASGGGTVTVAAGSACASVDTTNYTGTFGGTTALTVSAGGWIYGAGVTVTYTGTITFADTSGTTFGIKSNGKQFKSQINIDGVGGVFQLTDTFNSTKLFNVVHGSFSQNGQSMTALALASNSSNVRSITLNGALVVSGPASCIAFNTVTNLTFSDAGGSVEIQTTSAGTQTPSMGSGLTWNDLSITGAGTSATNIALGTSSTYNNITISSSNTISTSGIKAVKLDMNGFTGAISMTGGNNITLTGDLIMGVGMTNNFTCPIILNGTGAQTITSHTKAFASTFTLSGTGTVKLGDDFTNTSTITHTSGGFDTQSHAMTTADFNTSNTNTRSITLGSSVLTLTDASPWDATISTNLTLDPGTSNIQLTDSSGAAKAFNGGDLTYYEVSFQTSGAAITVSGSNTYNTFNVNPGVSILLTSTSTQTVGTFLAPGTTGSHISIATTTAGFVAALTKGKNFTSNVNFLDLTDIMMNGGGFWYIGNQSTISGSCTGQRLVDGVLNRAASSPITADDYVAPYDVWFVAGQSNALGEADATALSAPLQGLQEGVLFAYKLFLTPADAAGGVIYDQAALGPLKTHIGGPLFGPEITFGYSLWTQGRPNIALLKWAAGGSSLAVDWLPTEYALAKTYFDAQLALLTRPYHVRGVVWVQGEADGQVLVDANNYQANMVTLAAQFRADYGSAFRFLVYQLSSGDFAVTYLTIIRAAQAAFVAGDTDAALQNVDDQPPPVDGRHLQTQAMSVLGDREAATAYAA